MSWFRVTVVVGLLALYVHSRWRQPPLLSDPEAVYDYVVVGGGSAGCIVASRLSEDPDSHVLLLEAGPDRRGNVTVDMPMQYLRLWNTEVDWKFKTTPQEGACQTSFDKQCMYPRGKVLGGSGAINGMVYARGSRLDFDMWERDLSCKGWGAKDVLKYFKKLENFENDVYRASGHYGTDGPVTVTDSNVTGLTDTWLAAGAELGYPTGDPNWERQEHFAQMQSNIRQGVRWDTAHSHLGADVIKRPNLHVTTGAYVTRVLFDDKKRAVGVEAVVALEGTVVRRTVRARKEVVLSGGTVSTPHLLLLSGVGPKEQLKAHGIDVVADLPVGENFQDHMIVTTLQYRMKAPYAITIDKVETIPNIVQYFSRGTGWLSLPGPLAANAFLRSPNQPTDDPVPHLQLHLLNILPGTSKDDLPRIAAMGNMGLEDVEGIFGGQHGENGIAITPLLLHQRHTGTVRLASSDPFNHPLIDPRFLADPNDIEVFLDGIRLAKKVAATQAFQKLGLTRVKNVDSHCPGLEFDSDDYWRCHLRNAATTDYHSVGTCRMGAAGDPRAVVDLRLQVRGVKRLRVVDASVMPSVPSHNTNAASMMVGEKGADLIRNI